MSEFIPTLGNQIKAIDATLKDIPESCRPDYALPFEDTLIEEVIFSGDSFVEAAEEYCREQGWQAPA